MKNLEKSYKNTSLIYAFISKIRLYMNKVDKNHIHLEVSRLFAKKAMCIYFRYIKIMHVKLGGKFRCHM